jgi:hypothetical protein
MDGAVERPTVEEARELRTVLNRCKSITPEFDLTGGLDGGVWGTATIALLAVELDDVEFLDELVAEGHAASGLPNSLGATTLYFAANRRADSALIWALEKGVNPNQADVDGNTPLMMAAQHRANARMIEALIARGANVDAFAERGWTALAIAIRKENFANGALLVAAGADPELAKEFLIELTATSTNEEAQAEIADLIAAFELYLENQ